MTTWKNLGLIVGISALCGCATQWLPITTLYEPPAGFDPTGSPPPSADQVFSAPRDKVLAATVAVLRDDGYEMETTDEKAGSISTYWRARGKGASKMDMELVEREDGTHLTARCWMYGSSDIVKTPGFVYKMIYSKMFKNIRKRLPMDIKIKQPASP